MDNVDDATSGLEIAAARLSRCMILSERLREGEALTVGPGAEEGSPGVAEFAASSSSELLPDPAGGTALTTILLSSGGRSLGERDRRHRSHRKNRQEQNIHWAWHVEGRQGRYQDAQAEDQ